MSTDPTELVQGYRPLAELVPAHWQTGVIEAADGARIHYTRTGGALPAVLLLHGVQANGLTWLRTAQALETIYDVVMPDLRGHGLSSRVGTGLSTDLLVGDMIRLLRALNLERPYLVGHSMGADIAGRLAAVYPARALALVDPALRNFAAAMAIDLDAPPPWLVPIITTIRALGALPHAERMRAGLGLLPPGTPPWGEADYVSFVDAHAQFDLAVYRYAMGMGYLFEEPTLIAQIGCPILLLTARSMLAGVAIPPEGTAFEQHWRSGERVHFADSGHFIPFDQFERFITVLARFLGQHA